MYHSCKVLDTKLGFVAVFRRNVVGVELVLRVELIQHRSISSLKKIKKRTSIKAKFSKTYLYKYLLNICCTLGNLLSSSIREMMFMGLLAIMSNASWLSVNSMCCQLMSSRLYSSCSSLKTWRTKNCCKFSLAKLMHSCSKLQWKKKDDSVKLIK